MLELAEKVLARDPENQDALVYALDGLMQRENWQEAYDISRKIVNSSKSSSDVISRHITICLKLKKKAEAMEVSKSAYVRHPEDEKILQAYIFAYTETETRDSAISFINSMLAAENVSKKIKSYLYYRRSFLQPNEDAVLADLRSSLKDSPRNSDSLFRLYEIYFARSDYKKAQYYLKQVVSINPNDSSVKKLNEALTQLMN